MEKVYFSVKFDWSVLSKMIAYVHTANKIEEYVWNQDYSPYLDDGVLC